MVVASLFLSRVALALEKDYLLLQGQLEVSKPLSPFFITEYWDSSVQFSGGFGFVVKDGVVLCTYTNQMFVPRVGIIADGANGYAHEILLNYKRFLSSSKFAPFLRVSGGYMLMRTPLLYRESKLIPGFVEDDTILHKAHATDGVSIGFGVGLNVNISSSALVFFELAGSTAFLSHSVYSALGARAGILFELGY